MYIRPYCLKGVVALGRYPWIPIILAVPLHGFMAVYPGAVAAHTTGKKCCWEALGGNSALEPGWLFSQPFVVAQVLSVCVYICLHLETIH